MLDIALLIFPTFSEFEVTVAATILHHTHRIITVALSNDRIVSEAGLQYYPHETVNTLDPNDYQALLIPGAADISSVMDDTSIHTLIQRMDDQKKIIGAICAGPIVLAKAGILANRPYTVSLYRQYRDTLGCFEENGFRQQAIVEADNVITAQGYAFVAFGVELGKRLNAIRDEEAVAAYYGGQGDIHWKEHEQNH